MRSREPGPWSQAPPARQPLPVVELAIGFAAALSFLWWATAAEVLVVSARREGGRVLACRHLASTRVVEQQHPDAARDAGEQTCPVVTFG